MFMSTCSKFKWDSITHEYSCNALFCPPGLCSWVINIVKFYEVFCDVEPKRKALAAANAELAAAQEKLTKIKAKIKVEKSVHIPLYIV